MIFVFIVMIGGIVAFVLIAIAIVHFSLRYINTVRRASDYKKDAAQLKSGIADFDKVGKQLERSAMRYLIIIILLLAVEVILLNWFSNWLF